MADSSPTVSDFTPDKHPAGDFTPDPPAASAMDPHPVKSALRRVGKVIADYDPSNPANVGRIAPPVAGMATSAAGTMAGAAVGAPLTGAAIGGAAAPYVEQRISKLLGGDPPSPSWQDVAKSAILNAAFTKLGDIPTSEGATSEASRMAALPAESQNVPQLRQAVKDRSLWKALGLNDQQIDEAIANPNAGAQLERSIAQAKKIRTTFDDVAQSTRRKFTGRYADAMVDSGGHDLSTTQTDVKAVADQMRTLAEGQGQHELTPAFKSFLQRKVAELTPDPLSGQIPPEQLATLTPRQRVNLEQSLKGMQDSPAAIAKPRTGDPQPMIAGRGESVAPKRPPPKTMSVQQLRDLRTELSENVPSNPTNLDKQAAKQLRDSITNQYETTLRGAGATEEQIGQLRGIDEDYNRFNETLRTLDPRSERFGQQAADALFKTAQQHPEVALNFVKMASDAGKLPEFREQFLDNLLNQSTGGTPIEEMKALRKFQEGWTGTDAGKAVLNATFGKDSPLANPAEMSRILGAVSSPETKTALQKTLNQVGNVGFMIRAGVYIGVVGGSIYSAYNHPERTPAIIAATAGLMIAPRLLARAEPAVQRAYVGMVTNPTSVQAAQTFGRAAGAALSGIAAQPSQ